MIGEVSCFFLTAVVRGSMMVIVHDLGRDIQGKFYDLSSN